MVYRVCRLLVVLAVLLAACTEGATTRQHALQIAPTMVWPPQLDIKINGFESPRAIPYGSVFTVSWKAFEGSQEHPDPIQSCSAFGDAVPIVGEIGIWSELRELPIAGKIDLYAKDMEYDGYKQELHLTLDCFFFPGLSVTKEVVVRIKLPPGVTLLLSGFQSPSRRLLLLWKSRTKKNTPMEK